MTDLRTAAKQALEALVQSADCSMANLRRDAIIALKAALAEDALQRLSDVHQEIEAALEQPEPDYYLLPTNRKEPRPGLVNLEEFPGFIYESPNGWHIGDMKVVKWLLNNREADYWEQFKEKP
jgi:hypothetical protein